MQITYQAPDFDQRNVGSYIAIINGTESDGVEIALFEPQEKELKFWSSLLSFENKIGQDLVDLQFSRLIMIRENVDVSFFPNSIFEERMLPVYEVYLNGDGFSKPLVQELKALGVVSLEVPDVSRLPKKLLDASLTVEMRSDTSILLEGMASYLLEDENQTIGFHFSQDRVLVYFFDQGSFVFCNQYPVQVDQHVRAVIQDLNALVKDMNTCRCLVSGLPTGVQDAYFQLILEKFPHAQLADMAEVTGDALVPGELIAQQNTLMLYYLFMHQPVGL